MTKLKQGIVILVSPDIEMLESSSNAYVKACLQFAKQSYRNKYAISEYGVI